MFWIILILFAGFGAGCLLKGRVKLPTGTITTVSICLLLFALGLETGANRELLSNLPTMGAAALAVAVFGILGCGLAVKSFARLYFKLKERDLRKAAERGAGKKGGEA